MLRTKPSIRPLIFAVYIGMATPFAHTQQSKPELHAAIENLDTKTVRNLLENGADLNVTYYGLPALHFTVSTYVAFKGFAAEFPKELKQERKGEILHLLFEHGADPNSKSNQGETFLTHLIDYHGEVELAELALRNGADPNLKDELGLTPLWAGAGRPGYVKALLEAGADPNPSCTADKVTPLLRATAERSVPSLKLLLAADVDINTADAHDKNALHYLARLTAPNVTEQNGNSALQETFDFLVSSGCDPLHLDSKHRLPIHYAAQSKIKILLDKAISVTPTKELNTKDRSGNTPVDQALAVQWANGVAALAKAGSRLPENGLLARASLAYHDEFLIEADYLEHLRSFAAIDNRANSADEQGYTALHWAAATDFPGAVEFLLELGADPNAAGNDGRTPLHFAAATGCRKTLQSLLKAGADPAREDRDGNLASDHALLWDQPAVARILIENTPPSFQLLRSMIALDDSSLFKSVLTKEPLLAKIESDGSSLLHIAATEDAPEIVKILLDAGSDPNAIDAGNHTPLARAVASGNPETIETLLSAGAEPARSGACREKDSATLVRLLESLKQPLSGDESDYFLGMAISSGDLGILLILLESDSIQFPNSGKPIIAEIADPFFTSAETSEHPFSVVSRVRDPLFFRELAIHCGWKSDDKNHRKQIDRTLHSAASVGNAPLVRYLVEEWHPDLSFQILADEDSADPFGSGPVATGSVLQQAFQSGDSETASILIEAGAKLSPDDEKEMTRLLLRFAAYPDTTLLEQLLPLVDQPDRTVSEGDQTALMIAAELGSAKAVALLLENGADPEKTNIEKKTALDFAKTGGNSEVLELIQKAIE